MSRVGKLPVTVPQGVRITFQGTVLKVEGPKGTLEHEIPPGLQIETADSKIIDQRSTSEY